jgi:hypothetical protein
MKISLTIQSLNLFSGSCRRALKQVCYCLAVLLLLSMPSSAQTYNRDEICVRVDKVGESPGFWSGIVASTQWLDATVIASSSKGYKVGDKISFGLYVVQGDKFADRQTPRLNPKIIFAGAILTLGTKDGCRADGSTGWVYSCVKIGCSKRVSAAHMATGHADPPKPQ